MTDRKAQQNDLVQALQKIVDFLETRKIDYMIIGGIANSLYGNPRQTFDIDVKVSIEEESLSAFINDLALLGKLAVENPLEFVKTTNVLPVDVDDVRVDLILAKLAYEKTAIKRSRTSDVYGLKAMVSTAEDLVIQKCISTREKDWLDIREIIKMQREVLNWSYMLRHVEDLSEFLSDPSILKRINRLKNEK